MRAQRGFTLLEVMVSVAILGLALTVILSAEAGLYSAGNHAQHESIAVGMVRCKMGEIEEKLLREGYPELDVEEQGECCEDETPAGMRCSWKVQRIELPNLASFGENNPAGDGGLSLGTTGGPGGPMSSMLPKGTGAFGTLLQAGSHDAGVLRNLGSSTDGGSMGALSSMLGKSTSGGVAGIAPLVMGLVYPTFKPMLEASIRKITVTVNWTEGKKDEKLTVQQYVTNPMRGGFGMVPGTAGAIPPGSAPIGPGGTFGRGSPGSLTGSSSPGASPFASPTLRGSH